MAAPARAPLLFDVVLNVAPYGRYSGGSICRRLRALRALASGANATNASARKGATDEQSLQCCALAGACVWLRMVVRYRALPLRGFWGMPSAKNSSQTTYNQGEKSNS